MFDWIVSRKLERIARKASPDREFVRALEQQIMAKTAPRAPHSLLWKTAVGSLTGVVMLLSGTGVYAYTADDVLPDHPLYPVRTGIERVEESIAVLPRMKAAVAVQLLARRVKERELITQKKQIFTPEQEVRFFQTVEKAIASGDSLDVATQTRLDSAIVRLEEKYSGDVTSTVEISTSTPQFAPDRRPIVEQLKRIRERIEQLPPARRAIYENLLKTRLEQRQELRQRIRERLSQ